MDPPGLNLRAIRDEKNPNANQIRLNIIALQRVMSLFKPELKKNDNGGNASEREEAKMIWRFGQHILERCYGTRGTEAILLLKALVYFENFVLDVGIFTQNSRDSLVILKVAGLVRTVRIRPKTPQQGGEAEAERRAISVHGRIFGEIILEENRKEKEEDFIRDCLMLLRNAPAAMHGLKRDRFFLAIWLNASSRNYTTLMKEFRAEALQFCRTYHEQAKLTKSISKILEQLRTICTGNNSRIFRMCCIEIEIKLTLFKSEEKNLTAFKLGKLKEYFAALEDFLQNHRTSNSCHTRLENLKTTLGPLQKEYQGENSPLILKQKFSKACIRGYMYVFDYYKAARVVHNFHPIHDGPFSSTFSSILGIFDCAALLKKKEPILDILGQMLQVLKEHPGHEEYPSGPSFWLTVFANTLVCCDHFPEDEKTQILKALSLVMKYTTEFVYNSLHPRFCVSWSMLIDNYWKCLVKLQDFEQMIQMVKTANGRWKRKCELFLVTHPGQNGMNDFAREFFSWQNGFVYNHAMVTVPQIKEKLLNESIAASRIVLDLIFGIGRGCATQYNYSFSAGPIYLIQCFLALGQINELIEFSSEFELYIHQKFKEDNPHRLNTEWIGFLECLVETIRDRSNIASLRNNPSLPHLLQMIGTGAQRLSVEIDKLPDTYESDSKSRLVTKVQNIVQFCTSFG